jgi:glycosyltransferase involved in cell wall biosynthesis
MDGPTPAFSVVVPLHDAAAYIGEALDSLAAQTFGEFEIVVVDDGSTDGGADLVAAHPDRRIRLIRRPHTGISPTLDAGVTAARAPWIVRLDADDIALPDRMQTHREAIAARPDAVLSYGRHESFGVATPRTGGVRRGPRSCREFPATREFLLLQLFWRAPFAHSAVAFTKEAYARAGGYLESDEVAEDLSLWMRLAPLGPVAAIPSLVARKRRREGQVTQTRAELMTLRTRTLFHAYCADFLRLDAANGTRAHAIFSWADCGMFPWLWLLRSAGTRFGLSDPGVRRFVLTESLRRARLRA